MGAVVHVPVEGSAVSSALGISTDCLPVFNRKVVINPEVVANLVDKDLCCFDVALEVFDHAGPHAPVTVARCRHPSQANPAPRVVLIRQHSIRVCFRKLQAPVSHVVHQIH